MRVLFVCGTRVEARWQRRSRSKRSGREGRTEFGIGSAGIDARKGSLNDLDRLIRGTVATQA